LKVLPPELTRDPQAKARFVQEARAAAALDHPNLCGIFEIGEAEGTTYIAMPCVRGRSLKDRIAAGPPAIEEALDVAGQVAEAGFVFGIFEVEVMSGPLRSGHEGAGQRGLPHLPRADDAGDGIPAGEPPERADFSRAVYPSHRLP